MSEKVVKNCDPDETNSIQSDDDINSELQNNINGILSNLSKMNI